MPDPPPPNLLLVVLDCVRATDFPGGSQAVDRMPFVEQLRAESVHYPRAASVAHWTIPAHASMFTGLYPWEHGVHAKGHLKLGAEVGRVPERLRAAGYRTLSISANGLISPTLGLVDGCDEAAWGVSLFNRISDRPNPPQSLSGQAERSAALESSVRERFKAFSYWAAVVLARFPALWDGGTRVAMHLKHPANGHRAAMAQWLEPTVERWLAATPRDQPVYCFINLLDAHEPYLSDPDVGASLRRWWEYASTRQDRLGWVVGAWEPSPEEFRLLHELYRGMIRSLDRRLQRIVEAFRAAGRWENTMMVLTSDHGQAFGEHGALFHILGVDEAELRVPLFVRHPYGAGKGETARGWASLIDVAPTLLEAGGAAPLGFSSDPVSLGTLLDAPRSGPVLAMSDGIVHDPDRQRIPLERRRAIDRFLVAAYDEDRKVVVDPESGEVRAYDIVRDPQESRNLWDSERPEFAALADSAAQVGRRILSGPDASVPTDVEDRLRSWGYI